MSARFDPRDMDEDGRYISNAVLLEKINGFRTFYETRHSELMERVAHLEGVVKEVGEKAAERAAVLENREIVDRERIKTLFEANASGGTTPYTYAWNFGDGDTSTSENPSHTYDYAASYVVTLVVTDDVGDTVTKILSVTASSLATGVVLLSKRVRFG